MASTSQNPDILNFDEGRKKLPDMLNVLTILTFVGCGIGCISSVYSYVNAQKSYDDIVKIQDNLDSAPEFVDGYTLLGLALMRAHGSFTNRREPTS